MITALIMTDFILIQLLSCIDLIDLRLVLIDTFDERCEVDSVLHPLYNNRRYQIDNGHQAASVRESH